MKLKIKNLILACIVLFAVAGVTFSISLFNRAEKIPVKAGTLVPDCYIDVSSVSEDGSNGDYTFSGNVLTFVVAASHNIYEISGTTTAVSIVVDGSVTNLTLIFNNLSMNSNGPVTIGSGADVTIILADGTQNSLVASTITSSGISILNSAHLTIDGTGALYAEGGVSSAGNMAGIYVADSGVGSHANDGVLTIENGDITAYSGGPTANAGGAGIGGNSAGGGGTIIINGGNIVAKSAHGAGIGSGGWGNVQNGPLITINDGNIDAYGSAGGSGIGGGYGGTTCGDITINGGTVKAQGGDGAGIGSGGNGIADVGGNIAINGGIVVASSYTGNAIGSGSNAQVDLLWGPGVTLKINKDADVTAISRKGKAINTKTGLIDTDDSNNIALFTLDTPKTVDATISVNDINDNVLCSFVIPATYTSFAFSLTQSNKVKFATSYVSSGTTITGIIVDSTNNDIEKFNVDDTFAGYDVQYIDYYKITFSGNGRGYFGTTDITSKTYNLLPGEVFSSKYTLPQVTLNGVGYTFAGWYYGTAAQNPFTVNDSFIGNITVYAIWTLDYYTISFDPNYQDANAIDDIIIGYNENIGTLPTLARTGYIFDGWYTDPSDEATKFTLVTYTIADDSVLVAKWTAKQFTITYNTGFTSITQTQTGMTYGQSVGTLPTLQKDYYTFLGWYTDTDTQVVSDSTCWFTSDIILYAKWDAYEFTIKFDLNYLTEDTLNNVIANYEQAVGTLPSPERVGYDFLGWYTDISDELTEYTDETVFMDTDNIILIAKWQAQTFQMTYDTGFTDILQAPKDVTYDVSIGTLPTLSKGNYTFLGWYMNLTDSSTKVESDSIYLLTNGVTLYAKWQPYNFVVSFDLGYITTNTESSINVDFGGDMGTLPQPIRTGYDFLGWYTDINDENTAVTDYQTYTASSNTALTAKWAAKTFTVTFDTGSIYNYTVSVNYDASIGTISAPERQGYNFVGWYTEDGTQFDPTSSYQNADDLTVYAKWEVKEDPTSTAPATTTNTNTKTKVFSILVYILAGTTLLFAALFIVFAVKRRESKDSKK